MSLSGLVHRRTLARLAAPEARAVSLAVLCGLYLIAVLAVVLAGGGPFTYPLDDAYIHMAIGRTLATAGIWGASPDAAAAASSSPLWSLLLALTYGLQTVGLFIFVPLLLNMAAACGLIWLLLKIFKPRPAAIALAFAIIYAVALPSLSVVGMEHVLHALLATALCYFVCRSLVSPAAEKRTDRLAALGGLAAFAVAARYESLFLLAPLIGLSALRLRFRLALALGLGAALPVLGFGLLWIHDGGWLLPNSLLLKSHLTGGAGLIARLHDAILQLVDTLHPAKLGRGFLIMLAGSTALLGWRLYKKRRLWDFPALFALSALAATAGHLGFAAVGWLYRYESWLIVLNLVAMGILGQSLLHRRGTFALAALIIVAFTGRTWLATHETCEAMDDRRLEHVAPARFVDRFYAGQTVMVNDLGAMAWFAPNTRLLDTFGLGNNEPVRLRQTSQGYDAAALRDWAAANGARIAVLQTCWEEVSKRLPDEWRLIATWRVPRNVVFGDVMIGFFAIAPGADETLRRQLESFPVPPNVVQRLDPPRVIRDGCSD